MSIGTLTFLLTDIEGSTRLWEDSPVAMQAALARHDTLIAGAASCRGGCLLKSRGEGDSHFVVFESALDAVLAACEIQTVLHAGLEAGGIPLRVRMALHAGNAEHRDNDYFGPVVNRCARLRSIAHGGQILISSAVYSEINAALPDDTTLRDMGSHRLKDLQQPEHVWQVCYPGLPHDFPPLRSLNLLLHNLPVQITSFVGREAEIAEIKRLLAKTSLLTLLGTGGVGKTRLALQVAADVVEGDGVWFIPLETISDPELVPQAAAEALGIREEPGTPLLQTLLENLKPKSLLLVLDNCEQLISACAQFALTLLSACPSVKILAASRECLNVAGEIFYRVPSLSVPALSSRSRSEAVASYTDAAPAAPPVEALMKYAAVRLFYERVTLHSPDFTLTAENAQSVAEICHRLDGIPLALELAAARIRSLAPSQILARLNDRFKFLTGGSRAALPRQQTLQALMDWSYDLLTDQEKTFFQRLCVFAGGWTLEAAETICECRFSISDLQNSRNAGSQIENRKSIIENYDVLDLLLSLVDKSLVVYSEQDGEGRYRLLETLRQYARQKQEQNPDIHWSPLQHTDYYLHLAEEAEPYLQGPEQAVWLSRLEQEHDNLRAALTACLSPTVQESDLPAKGLSLCVALWWFWNVRGYMREGRAWLEKALEANAEPSEKRAQALTGLGTLAWRQNDLAASEAAHQASLSIHEANGNLRGIAGALTNLGNVTLRQGSYGEAQRCYGQAGAIWQSLGDSGQLATVWNNLGTAAYEQGLLGEARSWYEQSLAALRRLKDARSIAVALYNLGELATEEKDYPAAKRFLAECLDYTQAVGDRFVLAYALHGIAKLAGVEANWLNAVRLWAASQSLRDELGASLKPDDRAELDAAIASAKQALGETEFSRLWSQGSDLSIEDAILLARD